MAGLREVGVRTPSPVLSSGPARASRSTPFSLPLQKLHGPPGEEVEGVAVGVLLADIERRVLVSCQRALLEKVAQGVVVTIRARLRPEPLAAC